MENQEIIKVNIGIERVGKQMFIINKLIGVKVPIDTKEIVKQFASAVHDKDINLIASLLADDGIFENREEGLHLENDKTKATFLKWFIHELSSNAIYSVNFDTCNSCYIGNPVLLFNDGQFPATKPATGWGNNSISAMMLGVANGKINMIKFCNSMKRTKSKFWFQVFGEEIMLYERETDAPFNEAYEHVLLQHGQWDEIMRNDFRDDSDQLFKPKYD